MPLAGPDLFLETFLSVDVDHHAAEPGGGAIGTVDGGANRTYPVTFIRMPVHPVLNVEIAAGIDRLLHGSRRVIAILCIEQGKKESKSTGASGPTPKSLRVAVDQVTVRVEIRDPSRRRRIARRRCARSGRADLDLERGGRGRSCFAFRLLLLIRYRIKSGRVKWRPNEISLAAYLVEIKWIMFDSFVQQRVLQIAAIADAWRDSSLLI